MIGRLTSLALLAQLALPSAAAGDARFEALASIADVPRVEVPQDGIRGITIAPIEDGRLGPVGYGSRVCAIAVEEIACLGASWISLTPFGRMDDLSSTEIQHDFEIPIERNEDLIRETALQALRAGLRVAIIPHVYVMSGRWRGEIDPGSDEAWCEWFEQYGAFARRFAVLAEEIGAEMYSIGVEFKSSTNFWSDEWRALIREIRGVYTGQLTYSANWDEAADVPFWDALDLIGINAFWPLGQEPGDGYEVMRQRAGEVADELELLATYHDRPVVFTEVGVKTATDSALAPWEWPEHCSELTYDEPYQAAAYRAWLETMTDEPWFAGLFVWKYFSDPYDETQELPTGFTPHGKLAELELVEWFRRDWRLPSITP
ncbi:MAG: hypothetical protein JRF63_10455 [Deltaproteobacteria bacterium]|nr:hypothetical protein [Deltaproteobacteria bacterium]